MDWILELGTMHMFHITHTFRNKVPNNSSNRSLTAKIGFYKIFKPQSNRSGLYVNNGTLRSNRSLPTA